MARLVDLLAGAPGFDRPAAMRLSDGFAGRANEPRFDLMLTLIDLLLVPPRPRRHPRRRAGPGLGRRGRAHDPARPRPGARAGCWADLQQTLSARARHGKAVNLDPGSLILDTLFRIDEAARTALR